MVIFLGGSSVTSEMAGILFERRGNGGFITPGDGGWALFCARSSLFATSETL